MSLVRYRSVDSFLIVPSARNGSSSLLCGIKTTRNTKRRFLRSHTRSHTLRTLWNSGNRFCKMCRAYIRSRCAVSSLRRDTAPNMGRVLSRSLYGLKEQSYKMAKGCITHRKSEDIFTEWIWPPELAKAVQNHSIWHFEETEIKRTRD